MTRKLILLNGPIGCGKTEAVSYLKNNYDLVDRRCKDKLFKLTQELFCVDEDTFWEIYNNRELKESPNDCFVVSSQEAYRLYNYLKEPLRLGTHIKLSIREAMIYVSEIVCKPAFGTQYFGKARIKDMSESEVAIDDSCGFVDELIPAIEELGQDSILLIRIHGRGSFNGDSRAYIPDGVIYNTVDVSNTNTFEEFTQSLSKIVGEFLDE